MAHHRPSNVYAVSEKLTRAKLLERKPAVMLVEAPDLGGHVYVRKLGFRERLRLSSAVNPSDNTPNPDGDEGLGLLVVFLTVCDEHGERIFTKDEDMATIRDTHEAAAWDDVARAALRFNGLGAESREEQKKTSAETSDSASPSI